MLVLDIKRICASRGIRQVYTFLMHHGFTHHSAARLARGEAEAVRLRHLTTLCELLHCTPNDLLRWQDEAGTPLPPDHPLAGLQDGSNTSGTFQKLLNLPLAEQQALLEKLSGAAPEPPPTTTPA